MCCSLLFSFFLSLFPPPPSSPLFPYTTLFRSQVALSVLSALEAFHKIGIVHRDLKPSNIVLANGGTKLLDSGIAKHVALNADRKSTRLNSSHGYISYAVFCSKKKNKK